MTLKDSLIILGLLFFQAGFSDSVDSVSTAISLAMTEKGFNNPLIQVLSEKELYPKPFIKKPTHQSALSVIVFRDPKEKPDRWTLELVKADILRTAQIYNNCGLKFTKVNLILTDSPLGQLEVDGPSAFTATHTDVRLSELLPKEISYPVAFYVGKALNSSVGYENGSTAYAYNKSFVQSAVGKNRDSMIGMLFMTSTLNSAEYKKTPRDPTYNVLAHELGHILSNSGHVFDSNLMSADPKKVNGTPPKWLCTDLKESPFVQVL
jgi:hypothetical protein